MAYFHLPANASVMILLLLEIATFWSPRTSTFIFPWGGAIHGGLPVLGSFVRDKTLPEI
jgi:hypothetical protein